MKKSISIILVMILIGAFLFPLNRDNVMVSADDGNLIVNGDFETGTASGWTVNHPGNDWNVYVDTFSGHAHAGSDSLCVRHFWSQTSQSVTVEPNTDYKYSFWCKRTAGGSTATVTIGSKIIALTDSTDFAEYKGTVNSGTATSLRIVIDSNGGGGETYTYFDDFTFEKGKSDSTSDEESSQGIKNGGFEEKLNNWTVDTGGSANSWRVEAVTGKSHSGAYALQLRHFWSHTYQFVTVEPNTDYKYSFWCKRAGNGATTNINFKNNNAMIESVELKDSAEYIEYSGSFNTGNATEIFVQILSDGGNGNTFTYLDDIRLFTGTDDDEEEETPPSQKEVGKIENGGFEEKLSGWDIDTGGSDGSWRVEAVSGKSHAGTYALQVRHYWSQVKQWVEVKPNTDYTYSFWCKRAGNGATNTVSYLNEDGSAITTININDSSSYIEYTGTFNSGSSGKICIMIYGNGGNGDTFTYFDDFTLSDKQGGGSETEGGSEDEEGGSTGIVFDGNVIENGDFEDQLDKWNVDTGGSENSWRVQPASGKSHEGIYALQIRHFWVNMYQMVEVKPNTDYTYSFWCRRTAGNSTTSVSFAKENGSVITAIELSESAEYVEYSGSFNSGSAEKIRVWIQSNGGNGDTFTYLDDFILAKQNKNAEMYFDLNAGIRQSTTGSTAFVIKWDSVVSKEPADEITYSIYCSDALITGESLAEMTPVSTVKGNAAGNELRICDLKEDTGYWIAIKAEDQDGHSAYIRSKGEFHTLTAEQEQLCPPAGTNIITDGSFESAKFYNDSAEDTNLTPNVWHNYGSINKDDGSYNATFNIEQAYSGVRCLRCYPWTFRVHQVVSVRPNTAYSLSYKAYSYNDGVSVDVYGRNTLGELVHIPAKQSFEFERFEKTFNTGNNTEVLVCISNNVSGCHIAFIDDIIMVEVDNPDLYVAGEVVKRDEYTEQITIGWDPVNTALNPEDITYKIYMSESKITRDNIGSLTPVDTLNVIDGWYQYEISGLVPLKGYWFAVAASDPNGNTAYMFSREALSVAESEEEEDEGENEKTSDSDNTSDAEQQDVSYDDWDDGFADDEWYDSDDETDDTDGEITKKNAKDNWVKKTYVTKTVQPIRRKVVSNYLILWFIPAIIGLLLVCFSVISFIVSRRKKKKASITDSSAGQS